ncbi:FtsK/SpoIIIE domain-containing protein [Spiribacter roseus]|uniref:FtsK/SpoIIIE domain-containing protein n=1 Tax=Spiribacter roseus TaxID=1855875 RepID=UPI001330F9D6|nr:FtsK/SpoIIIE domain-containing protein [Spiribacter roseus]
MKILAQSLGQLLAARRGLLYLSVPSSMPARFLETVVASANTAANVTDFAFLVSKEATENSISAERATELRSREDGSEAWALIVAREGDFKELKSLEAFRQVNPGLVPNGVAGIELGELGLPTLCEAISENLVAQSTPPVARASDKLSRGLHHVVHFLGEAYRALGNYDLGWKDAWWEHVGFLTDSLPGVLESEIGGDEGSEHELARAVFEAAGLPRPEGKNPGEYAHAKVKDLAELLSTKWKSGEDAVIAALEVERKAIELHRVPGGAHHPIVEFDWSDFDSTLAEAKHPILALSTHGSGRKGHIAMWKETGEREFFGDLKESTDVVFREKCVDETCLPVQTFDLDGDDSGVQTPFVLASALTGNIEDNQVSIGEYEIQLKTCNPGSVSAQDIELKTSPANFLVARQVEVKQLAGGDILISFELWAFLSKSDKGRWREKACRLQIEPRVSSSAQPPFFDIVSLDVLVPLPGASSIYFSPSSTGKKGKRKILDLDRREYQINNFDDNGPAIETRDASRSRQLRLKNSQGRVDVLVVGISDDPPRLNGYVPPNLQTPRTCGSNAVFKLREISLAEGSELRHGGTTITVNVDDEGRSPLSPIIAAAAGVAPSTNETGDQENAMITDPRGHLEKYWLRYLYDGDTADSERRFPLALMFSDQDHAGPVKGMVDEPTGFFVVGSNSFYFPFSPRQVDSDLLEEFWNAFDDLGLQDLASKFTGNTSDWPSRIPIDSITLDKVNAYLSAYHELVRWAEKEKEGSWLYPFSALVVSQGVINGIMLSPLHPIRFAWNWSVQSAAFNAWESLIDKGVAAESLLRFVDGSGVPFCGPIPGDAMGQAVGVPIDPGEGDLFAAWSYLARREHVNTGRAYPRKVSGFNFPVGPFSGLDKGGVAAAINDYLRVHPYASELRLGLGANAPTPRSNELDRAVVAELDSLLKDRGSQLPGGIKIFDSNNREGPLPDKGQVLARIRSAMDELDRDDENRRWQLPFEWQTSVKENVDIRFLEDPLVRVSYEAQGELDPEGVMPDLPLKRFHLWSSTSKSEASASNGQLMAEQKSWLDPLPAVLSDVEGFRGKGLETWCQVVGNKALMSDNASWTVAGNDNLDPGLLADAMLRMGPSGQVLWEWRPPYLPRRSNKGDSSMLATKPYTVIARLEEEFKSRIRSELASVLGVSDGSILDDLFKTLGSKGVGIASLLTMGHQQSRGAIGFYLGFKLASFWENSSERDETRMVLPLDAVNPVFETLAGRSTRDDRKKADLLFVSGRPAATGGYHLDFYPIEIKMHGTHQGVVNFPGSNSAAVTAAVDQLKNTKRVLERFQAELEVSPRPVLVSTALASLIETGMMLSSRRQDSSESSQQASLLHAVASGACTVSVADGVLFWFEKNALGHGCKPFDIRKHIGMDAAVGLFVDPSACTPFEKQGRTSGLIKEFLKIFDGQNRVGAQTEQPDWYVTDREEDPSGVSQILSRAESTKPPLAQATPNETKYSTSEGVAVGIEDADSTSALESLSVNELNRRYDQIVDILGQNNITVYRPPNGVIPYSDGPASIMYRVKPAPDVRPEKIDSQREFLKLHLGLSAEDEIRTFVDKGCVVIVAPKPDAERYFFTAQQLWNRWQRPAYELVAPLGIDEYKEMVPLKFSSSKSPHLLIGGTTGSGKSEALNTILHGLSHHYSPAELRFLLVDPKGTEMTDFEEAPHLLGEIGWDDESASQQLEIAVEEMEERYKRLRSFRVRSITEYNKLRPHVERLPWWVVVLDEFADLTAEPEKKKKIEGLVGRLAQKARAAGIHVIIATQKPSAAVISTVLRSNLPAQLALRVKSATESRVIMDESGAETLNGKGDAFLKSEGRTVRIQCARYILG